MHQHYNDFLLKSRQSSFLGLYIYTWQIFLMDFCLVFLTSSISTNNSSHKRQLSSNPNLSINCIIVKNGSVTTSFHFEDFVQQMSRQLFFVLQPMSESDFLCSFTFHQEEFAWQVEITKIHSRLTKHRLKGKRSLITKTVSLSFWLQGGHFGEGISQKCPL